VTLSGQRQAVIDGTGKDALVVDGAQRVVVKGLEVRGGGVGVHAKRGANLTLKDVVVRDNTGTGLLVEAKSSAELVDIVAERNLIGVDVERGSDILVSGGFTGKDNRVFGILLGNTCSATFTSATVVLSGNVLGLQLGLTSSAFLNGPDTTLTASGNFADGVTVVTGSRLFLFGATLVSHHNQLAGVSAFSRSGIDLDAAALLESHHNADDGVKLESSLLRVFNIPAFSGRPGRSRVDVHENGADGVNAFTGSLVNLTHEAALASNSNVGNGLRADDDSSATIVNAAIASNGRDLVLGFGSSLTITASTFGSVTCDRTVLVRGDAGITCPAP
jgi:hypothetical protein